MLLKVSDGDGGWTLFDAVDKVHLLARVATVSNADELNSLKGDDDTIVLVTREALRKAGTVNVGTIVFERQGTTRKALFTNIAYVCNDRGDTLDRLSVDRRVEKKR